MSTAPTKKHSIISDELGGLHARFETDNLVIRSLEDEDLPNIIALQSNPEVMAFVGAGGARDEGKIKRGFCFYRDIWRRGSLVSAYIILSKEGGEFLGMAALEEVRDDLGSVVPAVIEPMIYLMPTFWRRGFAKEVGGVFVNLIVDSHNSGNPIMIGEEPVTKIRSTATSGNEASKALQLKMGFNHIGKKTCSYSGGIAVEKELFELDLSPMLSLRPPSTFDGVTADPVVASAKDRSPLK